MDVWPSEPEVARLVEEVAVCVEADCLYSPSTDAVRHLSGEPLSPSVLATHLLSSDMSRDVSFELKAVVAHHHILPDAMQVWRRRRTSAPH